MKKKIAIIIAVLMTFSLTGCYLTLTEPEEVVTDFFEGLKTKNEDALILYTKNEDINMLLHSKGNGEALDKMYESLFRNFSYKILSTKKNEEETAATMEVELANADFSEVLKSYQKEAYNYMERNLYSGDMSKQALNKKCLEIFAAQVEKAAEKAEPGSKNAPQAQTITINLTKNKNYSWDMELTEEMMEIIMGGLIIPL
ncbi:MAG: hypothetical protein HFE75_07975 [Firmicutes bacterium]|nr:hypothetical protein [Bacillota bacterium]